MAAAVVMSTRFIVDLPDVFLRANRRSILAVPQGYALQGRVASDSSDVDPGRSA